MTSTMDRRSFLRGSAVAVAGGVALSGPFQALAESAAFGKPVTAGYGPLAPVNDLATGLPLLRLPAGFSYRSFGFTGDPMDDGLATPAAHDGMAAFQGSGSEAVLVRNHELTEVVAFAPSLAYDPLASGGTTTLRFDQSTGQWLGSRASLAGTIRNCAGGLTPWGSWLSCEETEIVNGTTNHGYVFEVPADGVSNAEPLTAMGRFSHEANCT